MDITPSALDALFRNFALLYGDAFAGTKPWWTELATLLPSTGEVNVYGWMDRIPKMRKWVGPRQIQNVIARSQTITNVTFELTESISEEKLADDQLGLYSQLAKMMGEQAAKWPDQTILTDIFSANPLSYDGKAFFATDHRSNLEDASVGTIDNLDATAFSANAYGAARAKMMSWLGADGQPLGVVPDLLVVPPQLEAAARLVLTAEWIPSTHDSVNASASNVWRGSARLLVIPELAALSSTAWYLFDTSKVVKPMVFQLRKAPDFAYLNRPADPNVFWTREFIYGVSARGAAAPGLHFLAYKGNS